jgi:hypothetical protein
MSALAIERDAAETALSYRLAVAGDAIADAARLIAVNALAAEGAARRGDETEAFARLRAVADALDQAREIVRLAGDVTR